MEQLIKKIFYKLGFNISKISTQKLNKNSNSSILGYISANETITKANDCGLSICDYVEKEWNKVGDTKKIIDQIADFIVFENIKTICEIGAGTGRYMEKVFQICKPTKYESYEPDEEWATYLKRNYPIINCETNGKELKQTADNSIDLLHAHGVFVYLPLMVSLQYFLEICRVVKEGGYAVFDVISEDCLDNESVNKWLKSQHIYPCFLSTDLVDRVFLSYNFIRVGSFFSNYGAGPSKYLIYKKQIL